MITEKKRCSQCQNVIIYGLDTVEAECKITNKVWYDDIGDTDDRKNAEKCEYFNPTEEVWSDSTQKIVKSKDVNWI